MVRERLKSWRKSLLLVATAIVATAGGCHQTGRFTPRTLPMAAVAPRVSAIQQVDLSKLAQTTSSSDRIYPGDLLEVTIGTGIETRPPVPWNLRVSADGYIQVPEVGPVQVGDMTLPEAEKMVHRESISRGFYRRPFVAVVLKDRRMHRVTVTGAVKEPGTYELPAPAADIVRALVEAGGLEEDHAGRVEVREQSRQAGQFQQAGYQVTSPQGDSQSRTVDLVNVAALSADQLRLSDGAAVHVVRQQARNIQVLGLVNKSGRFEIPPNEEVRLLDAIAKAGGRTLQIADHVIITRTLPNQREPVVIEASVAEAKTGGDANVLLAAGDVVSVEETPMTFTVGTLQSFIRIGFSAAIPGL